jgi:hypothetical protein
MATGRTSIAIAGAALVLLLAGCGATPTGVSRTEAPAEPEASAVAASVPSVRVPLDCADLVDIGELETGTGTALTKVDPSVAAPAALESTAAAQYGALACAWSTGPLAIDSPAPIVTITVIPDVTAGRWEEYAAVRGGGDMRRGDYGTESFAGCPLARFDGTTCALDALVGDYWLSVLVAAPDSSVSLASAAPVFERATDVVRAISAPAAPRWTSGNADASRLDSATVSAAIAASGAFEGEQQTLTPQLGATWLPMAEADMTSFVYSGTGVAGADPVYFKLQVLPSGAWAFAELGRADGHGVAVDGLGDAAAAYPSPDGTAVVFTMGDDLVLVDVYGSASSAGSDTAQAVATAMDVAAVLG